MKKFFALALPVLGLDLNKNRPVSKVITLLKDMQKQLENESEQDQEIYDKLACWCTTNDKEKSKAIEDAQNSINSLTASIEEGSAKSARLGTEIANLKKEIAANQQALDKATALRKKQLADFNQEEKDLLQSIQALKNAITVLSKHHEQSLLQTESSEPLKNVATMLQHQLSKYKDTLAGTITPSQSRIVEQFVQQPTFNQAYAPQSGEIFGILKNMKDTFEANLATSQKDEAANQKAYQDLKAAKEDEINAGTDQKEKKQQQKANTDEQTAQDKVDLEATRDSLSADQEFLVMLKEKCAQTDEEFAARQKTRADEIQAVSKALEFLSSDDAHDLFTKTFNPAGFIQLSTSTSDKKRADAAALLNNLAQNGHPRLSAIAQKVKLDAFTEVKKYIDQMVTDLLKEKADEIKHRDFCINEFNTNEKETTAENNKKDQLEAAIASLESTIDVLGKEIKQLQDEIAEMRVQLKKAGENREKENADFQVTVQDQRATQKLLHQAMNVLKGFYEKAKGTALAQQPAGPPPPAGFKSYENNAAGGGVIAMITNIINDAKAMEREAVRDEEDAQAAYEAFVQETNSSINQKNKTITNKSEAKSKADTDRIEKEGQKDAAIKQLEILANTKADLHASCDFTLKNFDVRQEARDQEVEALRQAKAILSGAKFSFLSRN